MGNINLPVANGIRNFWYITFFENVVTRRPINLNALRNMP